MIGFSWGLGHTVVLLLVGTVVLVLRMPIPEPIALAAEFGVGMMLVFLGGMLGLRLIRERWHVHTHDHDGEQHVHLHSHALIEDHGHAHWWRDSIRPFCIGMAHGLAGSAALLLIVLSSAQSVSAGLMYIAVFGLGSIVAGLAEGTLPRLAVTDVFNRAYFSRRGIPLSNTRCRNGSGTRNSASGLIGAGSKEKIE